MARIQDAPQSTTYTKKADKKKTAKPVGARFTNKLAKRLGKKTTTKPSASEIEKFLGKGVYKEKRADKSDMKPKDKFAKGGQASPQSESYTARADKKKTAKPVGVRFTDKLAKRLGKKATTKPTLAEAEKYRDKGVYKENRKDKSDMNPKNRFAKGGKSEISHYKVGDEIFIDYDDAMNYCDEHKLPYSKIVKTKEYAKGGTAQTYAQYPDSYNEFRDIQKDAKPVGYRYTDALAKRLGVSPLSKPSKAHIDKYLDKGVYWENRADKSDQNRKDKLEKGGEMARETIIELAKRISNGTLDRTKFFPVADKVPGIFLSQLGILLENESNYVLVVEIQFDTEKIILQGYNRFGNFAKYSYRIEQLPITFKKWLKDAIRSTIDEQDDTYAKGGIVKDIEANKKALIKKAKDRGMYENFGEKEVDKLKDKYDYNSLVYGTNEEREKARLIDNFYNWASNYDGGEMAKGGKTHEQGYDDREDERLAMRHGKIASKDFVGSHKRREHSRRDDARFETRYAKGGQAPSYKETYFGNKWTKKADKEEKGKRVGYRYTDKLAKRLGVNKYAKPTDAHIEKYLGNGIYFENRKDKSDVSPKDKLAKGGTTQTYPQSQSYNEFRDIQKDAKPVGYRYTDALAKRLGVSPLSKPSKAHIDKYLDKGVYWENRADKSDQNRKDKLEGGGDTEYVKGGKTKDIEDFRNYIRKNDKTRNIDNPAQRIGFNFFVESHYDKSLSNEENFKNYKEWLNTKFADGGEMAKGGGTRISNSEASSYAENHQPFRGNNLEAKTLENGDYVVLSYGYYPIWYWNKKEDKWYQNKDKFSQTTARHITASRPTYDAQVVSRNEMDNMMAKSLEGNGFMALGGELSSFVVTQ